MPALTITVHISPRAAILAGKTTVGNASFNLTEEALRDLPEELRLELALAYETGKPIGEDPGEPAVVEPTLAAIRPVLEVRASRRKDLVEAERVAKARDAEVAAVNSREATAKDNARSKALRTWVDKHGDEEQKARLAEGFLPEDEILDSICEEVLDLPGFSLYDSLRKGDACDCACAGRVTMAVRAPRYMDAFQFSKLQSAREAVPEGASVEVFEHVAQCPACKCAPIARLEARVTMPWNGWLLVRQYALIST
jgi:hypothetical protein